MSFRSQFLLIHFISLIIFIHFVSFSSNRCQTRRSVCAELHCFSFLKLIFEQDQHTHRLWACPQDQLPVDHCLLNSTEHSTNCPNYQQQLSSFFNTVNSTSSCWYPIISPVLNICCKIIINFHLCPYFSVKAQQCSFYTQAGELGQSYMHCCRKASSISFCPCPILQFGAVFVNWWNDWYWLLTFYQHECVIKYHQFW